LYTAIKSARSIDCACFPKKCMTKSVVEGGIKTAHCELEAAPHELPFPGMSCVYTRRHLFFGVERAYRRLTRKASAYSVGGTSKLLHGKCLYKVLPSSDCAEMNFPQGEVERDPEPKTCLKYGARPGNDLHHCIRPPVTAEELEVAAQKRWISRSYLEPSPRVKYGGPCSSHQDCIDKGFKYCDRKFDGICSPADCMPGRGFPKGACPGDPPNAYDFYEMMNSKPDEKQQQPDEEKLDEKLD